MAGEMIVSRRGALAFGASGVAVAAIPGWAQAGGEPAVDAIVNRFMSSFQMPGIGVAIVRPNRADFTRGYGVRTLGRPDRVDEDTLFAIASNSKAFVAAGLALLVEEKKIGWDEPVIKHLPDFAMSNPVATQMMTVRDLLVHRSGLALGAGDLMQFPLSDHTRADIYRGLRYLPLARGFRSGYAYDNILYVVAGVLIERVSGMGFEDYVTARLLRPLGMRTAIPVRDRLPMGANVVGRHARLGPPVRGMGELVVVEADESPAGSPAGGIHASVSEITNWLAVQLGKGQMRSGKRLWSEAQSKEMWTPQVITASTTGPTADNPAQSVLSGYALGWFIGDYRGNRLVHHSGGLSGQITQTALLPERGIGLCVFTNTEDRHAVVGLRNALLDYLLGQTSFDWVAYTRKRMAADEAEAVKLQGGGDFKVPPGGPSLPLSAYAGRYRDAWYGDVVVSERAGRLHIDFTRTPVFKSALETFGPDSFRTRFAKGAGEDAVVTFVVANGAVTGIRMKALSPLADFSYDFHDLNLKRVN